MYKIALLIGSLRRESINRQYAQALEKLGADRFSFDHVDMNLPLYNDDLWAAPPKAVTRMKDQVAAADAVLIVSPEYNRSMPAVTKNALDWGSRPFGHNVWKGKPVAVTGASPGAQGTAVMQSQLRSTLVILGMAVLGEPEVYMTFKPDFLSEDGTIANEGTARFLSGFLDNFVAWIERTKV
ncbi:NAD(P)H-dependent oxidoreductase [Asticcacaulis sp. EMRT-3]|uniref:NADPH-dependent FMN reductase n=1 Tax=Asticcacaulis sp. EMRT-3 TaxID=3040349 RepID=UPI0024AEAA6C|nr:NAD(P)H-dependent oxidoreductase [Asticcacaulis sp. EMRT-3]MDI7774218.1 NAD(P)H-dependent oxidoreductase [Asticcacaulis sp. EMRT-3]